MSKSSKHSSKKHSRQVHKVSETESSASETEDSSTSGSESELEEPVTNSKVKAKVRKSRRLRRRRHSSVESDESSRRSLSKRAVSMRKKLRRLARGEDSDSERMHQDDGERTSSTTSAEKTSKKGTSRRKKSHRVIESDSESEEMQQDGPGEVSPDAAATAATAATGADENAGHVSKFGVNSGMAASVAPPSAAENALDPHDLLAGTGISLDPSKIKDISVMSTDRLKEVVTFQLGSSYFIRVGPTPFHAQGGTYDAMCFGKIITEKEGGKEKPVSINLPIRTIPQVVDAFRDLHNTFVTKRNPLTVAELTSLKESAGGKDIDLVPRLQYMAPKEGFKIDTNHVICGETVSINKTASYEAITVCRLPKTNGANGKPTKKFSISFPLRFLPTLVVLAEYVCELCNVNN